jgi:hypothetical protein
MPLFNDMTHAMMWPKLLNILKREYEMKTIEEQKIGARSLTCNTSRVKGRAKTSGWD